MASNDISVSDVGSENVAVNNENILYIGCQGNEKLYEEKLESIVGYAMQAMGISQIDEGALHSSGLSSFLPSVLTGAKEVNAELSFNSYCQGLGSKLGPYEPYIRSVHLKTTNRQTIRKDMLALLPNRQPEFDIVLHQAADHAETTFEMPITDIRKLYKDITSNELILSQFVVLKVFRAGDNLEIVPCLFKVKSRVKQGSMIWKFFEWSQCEFEMKYEERKYVLTKFMIREIIEKLNNKNYGF